MKKNKFKPLVLSSESGYTILEGLVAIMVVAALLSFIGPVVAYSVGTRVQAKRVELAARASRSFIETAQAKKNDTAFVGAIPTVDAGEDPSDLDPPNAISLTCPNSNAYCTIPANLYCVDSDGIAGCTNDSLTDMIVQPARTFGDPAEGFLLGVRVYRANSFTPGIGNALGVTLPSTNITNALGNRNSPLMNTVAEVIPDGADYRSLETTIEQR